MYLRLAFAVAAHLQTEILIVDEVLAVGDAEFQKKCLGKMQDVSKGGRTVIFVSHNMSAVRGLCRKAILLSHGSVIGTGSSETIIDKYLDDSNKDTGLSVDFTQARRDADIGTRVTIDRVRINQGVGLWHGRPLDVEFEFTGIEDVEGVSFGIAFCNLDGARIMTLDSDLNGTRWAIQRGQKGIARLRIPELLLEPDHYLIDIGSRSGDHAGLEYFPQCTRVLVVPSESTPPLIAMRESGRGGVRFPSSWTIIPSEYNSVE
jgi:lipopolysaccharide transport system ATP-binding protein